MTRKPYVVDLADLGSETLSLQGRFAPGDIDFSGDDVQQLRDLNWTASVQSTGGGARFAGELDTEIRMACVRCVEPVDQSLHRKFDLFFERREAELYNDDDEIELDESDTSTAFMVGTELFIDEIMHEQIVLAVPMKPLCDADCKGLCAHCGANLNRGACDCASPVANPAFEPLLELRKRLEGRE